MLKKIFTSLLLCATLLVMAETPTPQTQAQAQAQAQTQSTSQTAEQAETQQPSAPELPTQEIPPLPSSTEITQSYEGSFIRVIVSLIGLVVLVVVTFWILKRLGRGRFGKLGSDKLIHIIERRNLSPKSVLYLVQIENKRVLLSESQFEVRSHASFDLLEEEKEE
jgi:flagellar biogenesis protein FliO